MSIFEHKTFFFPDGQLAPSNIFSNFLFCQPILLAAVLAQNRKQGHQMITYGTQLEQRTNAIQVSILSDFIFNPKRKNVLSVPRESITFFCYLI